jgi:hypothetical protein
MKTNEKPAMHDIPEQYAAPLKRAPMPLADDAATHNILQALSGALGGSIQRTAELYEQYATLLESDIPALPNKHLGELSYDHQRQLQLASRILTYSLSPPEHTPQPVQLEAFVWEWAMSLPEYVRACAPPSGPSDAHTVMLDQSLLQPLMEAYIRESHHANPELICYQITTNESSTHSYLTMHPISLNLSSLHDWSSASQLLSYPEKSPARPHSLDLSISYAAVIESLYPATFAQQSHGACAMRIALCQLK